LGFLPLI